MAVRVPPRKPYCSMTSVRAPERAAAMAAIDPQAPRPTTTTS